MTPTRRAHVGIGIYTDSDGRLADPTIRESRTVALARCLREQAACKAYLDGPGEDKAGAWDGLCDWMMEEAIIRTGRAEFGDRTRPAQHDTGEYRARKSYTT